MKLRILSLALLTTSLLGATAFAAPPEGKGPGYNRSEHAGHPGKGHGRHHDERGRHGHHHEGQRDRREYRERDTLAELINAGITAALARQYAHQAGARDYRALPPGIRKNLRRGKPLPPGIARKVQSRAFLDRLPRHSGYEWQAAGTDLVLVSIATGVIADILFDVFD